MTTVKRSTREVGQALRADLTASTHPEQLPAVLQFTYPSRECCVYVSSLGSRVCEADIWTLCRRKVNKPFAVKFVEERLPHMCVPQYCIVTFWSPVHARQAVERMNRHPLHGERLRVSLLRDRRRASDIVAVAQPTSDSAAESTADIRLTDVAVDAAQHHPGQDQQKHLPTAECLRMCNDLMGFNGVSNVVLHMAFVERKPIYIVGLRMKVYNGCIIGVSPTAEVDQVIQQLSSLGGAQFRAAVHKAAHALAIRNAFASVSLVHFSDGRIHPVVKEPSYDSDVVTTLRMLKCPLPKDAIVSETFAQASEDLIEFDEVSDDAADDIPDDDDISPSLLDRLVDQHTDL